MRLLALLSALTALVLTTVLPAAADTAPRGVWPLRPRPEVVRTFDPPEVLWGSGHRGVDLRGTAGQPVRAALSGRVSFTGRIAGVAVVVVDHGRTRTTYQPVSARAEVGAEVAAGAVIGVLEWHGTHCQPAACLHWGLVRGDTYLDPLMLVDGPSPVRLFPVGSDVGSGGVAAPPVPAAPVTMRPMVLPPSVLGLTPWS